MRTKKQPIVLSPKLMANLQDYAGPQPVDVLIEKILNEWVEAQENPQKSALLLAKIEAFEARLALLEVKSAARPGKRKSKPAAKPLADGGRWLITKEAWERACERGCNQSRLAFSKLATAHPERLIAWDLKFLGASPSGNSRLASFQDLLWED